MPPETSLDISVFMCSLKLGDVGALTQDCKHTGSSVRDFFGLLLFPQLSYFRIVLSSLFKANTQGLMHALRHVIYCHIRESVDR